MNTESKKVLLLGIGDTGLEVAQILERNEVHGLNMCEIKEESELKLLSRSGMGEAELIILVAEPGCEKENSLAIKASRLAKDQCKVAIAILTTPCLSEGEKAVMRALETAQEIGKIVDSLLVINDSLLVINKETFNTLPENGCSFADLINSLVSVEETIADGILNMMSLISEEGAININLDDLKTTLAHSGTFTVESGFGVGENRIELAIENALSSPLMKKSDVYSSRKALIKVLAPKISPITVEEMQSVSKFTEEFSPNADIKWGMGEADDDDIVSVIILVSGFDVKLA